MILQTQKNTGKVQANLGTVFGTLILSTSPVTSLHEQIFHWSIPCRLLFVQLNHLKGDMASGPIGL